jgi:peptide/nickel transport system permease protein
MLHLLPGDPARAILGPRADAQQLAQFRHDNGFDRSIPVQYGIWLRHLVHGDLGFSYKLNQSVGSLIIARLPKTLVLMIGALLLTMLVAIPLGLLQAVRRTSVADYTLTGASFVFYATPSFFLGIILIDWFADNLHLFGPTAPTGGLLDVLSDPRDMVLPIVTVALITIAQFSRYMRSAALDNLGEDYVRTAKAKGASDRRILLRHVVRNAMIPIVTLLGLNLPLLFSGALVTETVFNYPGMGYLFWQAAAQRDYPILLGVSLVVALATVVGSLLADVAYAVLDPRVRYVRS